MYIPTAQPERTPIPATPDIATLVEGYKGREGLSGGELVDTAPLALEARIIRPDPINGVKVALLPKDTRGDLVQLSLNLHYGDADSLKGLTTAAEFLGPMLQRGTEKLTRQQIQDTLDKNLAQLSVGGDAGTLAVNLQTKRENLPAVLEVLQQVLRAPTFPESEFETLKAQQIAQLEQNRTEPTFLASNRMQRLLSKYPADDVRYVPTIDEQAERLKSLTLDQIRTLHREYLGAGHGELAAVGDFEPSELIAGLKPILEGWSGSKPYARIENPFQAGIEATTERIITPDKANAIYLSALPIQMKDSSPEYPAMTLGGYILGGGALSSRIADRLRQKDGLSYGAGASFSAPALDDRGRITVFAIYNPGNLDKVSTGVEEELKRWVDGGVTAEELDKARSGYLQQRQVMRSNDRMLSGMIATQLYNDRTFQFEADQEQAIRGLTPESINQTIQKIVDPSQRVIVNAGDFKTGDGK
jgi:zinc protease